MFFRGWGGWLKGTSFRWRFPASWVLVLEPLNTKFFWFRLPTQSTKCTMRAFKAFSWLWYSLTLRNSLNESELSVFGSHLEPTRWIQMATIFLWSLILGQENFKPLGHQFDRFEYHAPRYLVTPKGCSFTPKDNEFTLLILKYKNKKEPHFYNQILSNKW